MNTILNVTTTQIYVVLAIIFIILLIVLVFFLSRKKPIMKTVCDLEYLNIIYGALGGSENIVQAKLEHQRLQVKVLNMKNVSGGKFRELRIPAIVKGKDITLLIKNNTQEVLSYIQERKKEEY